MRQGRYGDDVQFETVSSDAIIDALYQSAKPVKEPSMMDSRGEMGDLHRKVEYLENDAGGFDLLWQRAARDGREWELLNSIEQPDQDHLVAAIVTALRKAKEDNCLSAFCFGRSRTSLKTWWSRGNAFRRKRIGKIQLPRSIWPAR